jgi:hypothetical protein
MYRLKETKLSAPCFSSREVFTSDHQDIIPVESINCKLKVFYMENEDSIQLLSEMSPLPDYIRTKLLIFFSHFASMRSQTEILAGRYHWESARNSCHITNPPGSQITLADGAKVPVASGWEAVCVCGLPVCPDLQASDLRKPPPALGVPVAVPMVACSAQLSWGCRLIARGRYHGACVRLHELPPEAPSLEAPEVHMMSDFKMLRLTTGDLTASLATGISFPASVEPSVLPPSTLAPTQFAGFSPPQMFCSPSPHQSGVNMKRKRTGGPTDGRVMTGCLFPTLTNIDVAQQQSPQAHAQLRLSGSFVCESCLHVLYRTPQSEPVWKPCPQELITLLPIRSTSTTTPSSVSHRSPAVKSVASKPGRKSTAKVAALAADHAGFSARSSDVEPIRAGTDATQFPSHVDVPLVTPPTIAVQPPPPAEESMPVVMPSAKRARSHPQPLPQPAPPAPEPAAPHPPTTISLHAPHATSEAVTKTAAMLPDLQAIDASLSPLAQQAFAMDPTGMTFPFHSAEITPLATAAASEMEDPAPSTSLPAASASNPPFSQLPPPQQHQAPQHQMPWMAGPSNGFPVMDQESMRRYMQMPYYPPGTGYYDPMYAYGNPYMNPSAYQQASRDRDDSKSSSTHQAPAHPAHGMYGGFRPPAPYAPWMPNPGWPASMYHHQANSGSMPSTNPTFSFPTASTSAAGPRQGDSASI